MGVECFLCVQDDRIREFGEIPENRAIRPYLRQFVKNTFLRKNRVNAKNLNRHQKPYVE